MLDDLAVLEPHDMDVVVGDLSTGRRDAHQLAGVPSVVGRVDDHGVSFAAATQPGIHRRSGPLLRALRDGMASDSELRGVWDKMEAWRLEGEGRFVAMLAGKSAPRLGLSIEEARDIVWTLCSLAVHDLLVVERGWTSERYQEWLASALTCALLPNDPA